MALGSFVVLVLTMFGALEGLEPWLRGVLQAVGSMAGVLCGYWLQQRSEHLRAEGSVRSAVAGLLGIAKGINIQMEHIGSQRVALANSEHRAIASLQAHAETVLAAEEAALRTMLTQIEAAVESWRGVDAATVEMLLDQQAGLSPSSSTTHEEGRKP